MKKILQMIEPATCDYNKKTGQIIATNYWHWLIRTSLRYYWFHDHIQWKNASEHKLVCISQILISLWIINSVCITDSRDINVTIRPDKLSVAYQASIMHRYVIDHLFRIKATSWTNLFVFAYQWQKNYVFNLENNCTWSFVPNC